MMPDSANSGRSGPGASRSHSIKGLACAPAYRFLLSCTLLLVLASGPASVLAAELLDETKNLVQQWVQTEQLISSENRQWREEKSSIEDLLGILEAEKRILDEQISLAEETASRADEERAALVEQLASYQAISAEIESRVADYERQLTVLQPRLPGVLQRELSPRFSRFDNASPGNSRPLSERVQTVLSLLAEIEAFDSTATLTTEVLQVAAGQEIEASVLYLGLSRAFYINGARTIAGVGVPGDTGWRWEANDGLAGSIAEALDIYESRVSPRLVILPMELAQ